MLSAERSYPQEFIRQVCRGRSLREVSLERLLNAPSLEEVHGAAILSLLEPQWLDTNDTDLRRNLLGRWPLLGELELRAKPIESSVPEFWFQLRDCLRSRASAPPGLWRAFASAVATETLSDSAAAFVLMEITKRQPCESDTVLLTQAMVESGIVFDYRPSVRPRRLVRRYPSGGVSEKVALILPSLLAAAAAHWPVASSFLVARSLSFTGGTWDKLSVIPGFRFPQPGEETLEILRKCHVAMCVTSGSLNPCDRRLYALRSRIEAVESRALIVSSISSKHLALPVDYMLLDMLYGEGAFFAGLADSDAVSAEIRSLLVASGIPCEVKTREASEPTGIAIGNAPEVAEAIAVMRGRDPGSWELHRLDDQWQVVRGFFADLMFASCALPRDQAEEFADSARRSGLLLSTFGHLLEAHGVSAGVIRDLLEGPERFFWSGGMRTVAVSALARGTVSAINYKRIGLLVANALSQSSLSTDLNSGNAHGGCLLRSRVGSAVAEGQVLCELLVPRASDVHALRAVASGFRECFTVPPSSGQN